jgi:hypothetical protein
VAVLYYVVITLIPGDFSSGVLQLFIGPGYEKM